MARTVEGVNGVSAVIPAFNAAAVIARAIDSVLAQSRPPDEIVVVDDGSTDDTRTVVEAYGRAVRYVWQPNRGAAAARNLGIAAARHGWIAFLDADDAWLPDKLERQLAIIDAHGVQWCSGRVIRLVRGRRVTEPALPKWIKEALRHGAIRYFEVASQLRFGMSAMLCHRSLLEEAGMFDERLSISEDRDMWWRIGLQHGLIGYCTAPCCLYHMDTPDSLVKRSIDRTESLQVVCDNLLRARALDSHNAALFEDFARFLVTSLLRREASGEIALQEAAKRRAEILLGLTPLERFEIGVLRMLPPSLSRKVANGVVWLGARPPPL